MGSARFKAYLTRRGNEMLGIAAAVPLAVGESQVRAMEDQFLDLDDAALGGLGAEIAALVPKLREVRDWVEEGQTSTRQCVSPTYSANAPYPGSDRLPDRRRAVRIGLGHPPSSLFISLDLGESAEIRASARDLRSWMDPENAPGPSDF